MSNSFQNWPEWWGWEIEFIPHLLKRMLDRQFNEVSLRIMLDEAIDYAPEENDRFIILTKYDNQKWKIIVEPEYIDRVLLIITAYPEE
jgi:hypothetical protein